jgi:hypothetical protein
MLRTIAAIVSMVMTGLCGSVYKTGSAAGRDLLYRSFLHYSFAGFLHEVMPSINPPPARPILSGLSQTTKLAQVKRRRRAAARYSRTCE